MVSSAPQSRISSRPASPLLKHSQLLSLPASAPGSRLPSRPGSTSARPRKMTHSLPPLMSSAGNAWRLREPSMEGHTFHASFGTTATHRLGTAPLQQRGGQFEPTLPECAVHTYDPVRVDHYREGRPTCAIIGNDATKRCELPRSLCPVHAYEPPQGTLCYGQMSVGETATFSTVPRVPKPQPALNSKAFYRPVPLDVYREVSHRGCTFGREPRKLLPIAAAA
eukprot:CAMPEP_0119343492 /NCGR_PEP_ID=MMETSP1333-20130426/106474_1 /TAXON_ID=418940 /ORGANISM="Scyphosphaera apsteinii, Strain RCC1455" /LENGTH=222 /DNA_ID=CAMNT_0007355883 /DNA_START=54 /DNA_END=722 /DNA_ORIENTATION=+